VNKSKPQPASIQIIRYRIAFVQWSAVVQQKLCYIGSRMLAHHPRRTCTYSRVQANLSRFVIIYWPSFARYLSYG